MQVSVGLDRLKQILDAYLQCAEAFSGRVVDRIGDQRNLPQPFDAERIGVGSCSSTLANICKRAKRGLCMKRKWLPHSA
jgi:hypothetical protein